MAARLERVFYGRSTLEVTPELIGKFLVRRSGRSRLVGRIVEAEAYLAHPDRASHASRKNPKRAAIMFGPPGFVYVYLIYGMYHCLNLVTETDGVAGAILVRAIKPGKGVERMRRSRGRDMPDRNLTNGPGKLCRAMQIDLRHNGADGCGDRLWLEDRGYRPRRVARGPRIGVEYAGAWARKPWRFWEEGNAFVSR